MIMAKQQIPIPECLTEWSNHRFRAHFAVLLQKLPMSPGRCGKGCRCCRRYYKFDNEDTWCSFDTHIPATSREVKAIEMYVWVRDHIERMDTLVARWGDPGWNGVDPTIY